MYREEEPDPSECEHNWVFIGTGTMIDPETNQPRQVNHYTCSKCGTSMTEWA